MASASPSSAVAVATLVGLAIDRCHRAAERLLDLSAGGAGLGIVYGGYPAALAAAVLSAFAYNFFFIEPVDTFTIAAPHEVFGLLIYVVAALIAGGLASRMQRTGARRAGARGIDPVAL